MNCKPGDLAIVVRVRHNPENLGKIVRVVSLKARLDDEEPAWVVDPVLPDEFGVPCLGARDKSLRPLRGDLTDDTEQAEQPRKVTA